jgi:hypothetical protein
MEEKVKESDITIENDTASWGITYQGQIGGTYLGVFRFRTFLTPAQLLEADRDFRELLGPNAQFAATNAENIAYALAQLKQRIIESPPFWRETSSRFGGSSVKDLDCLDLVLEAAVASEIKYRKLLAIRHEEALKKLQAVVEKRKEQDKINEEFAKEPKKKK